LGHQGVNLDEFTLEATGIQLIHFDRFSQIF